jgi:hypothetical protein
MTPDDPKSQINGQVEAEGVRLKRKETTKEKSKRYRRETNNKQTG